MDLLWCSGHGLREPLNASRVQEEAARLATLQTGQEALAMRSSDGRAARAVLGARYGGPVAGLVMGEEAWVALAAPAHGEEFKAAVEPLRRLRRGRCDIVALEDTSAWLSKNTGHVKAVCLLGRDHSWEFQETLQRRHRILVGRVPGRPDAIHGYATRVADRETLKVPKVPRRALLLCAEGAGDIFTRSLASRVLPVLEAELKECGFSVDKEPNGVLYGLVVSLTHGADPTDFAHPRNYGQPVQVGTAARHAIDETCAAGGVFAHFGCNSAGLRGGGLYQDLLGICNVPHLKADRDDMDSFAAVCLERGAGGVLAHVDSTWSCAFDDAAPAGQWVSWLASGAGTVGYAQSSLVDGAKDAADMLIAGDVRHERDPVRLGRSWLRNRDLLGFVTLGDPCATIQWDRQEASP